MRSNRAWGGPIFTSRTLRS